MVTVGDDSHVCQLLSHNTVFSAFIVEVLEMLSHFLVSFGVFLQIFVIYYIECLVG